jgi:hypothetical protein
MLHNPQQQHHTYTASEQPQRDLSASAVCCVCVCVCVCVCAPHLEDEIVKLDKVLRFEELTLASLYEGDEGIDAIALHTQVTAVQINDLLSHHVTPTQGGDRNKYRRKESGRRGRDGMWRICERKGDGC